MECTCGAHAVHMRCPCGAHAVHMPTSMSAGSSRSRLSPKMVGKSGPIHREGDGWARARPHPESGEYYTSNASTHYSLVTTHHASGARHAADRGERALGRRKQRKHQHDALCGVATHEAGGEQPACLGVGLGSGLGL
eukprot:scaffold108766_cov30-Phaeocystis_antarctica.AAC.1